MGENAGEWDRNAGEWGEFRGKGRNAGERGVMPVKVSFPWCEWEVSPVNGARMPVNGAKHQ